MQMSMIVYSTIDVLEEKQKLINEKNPNPKLSSNSVKPFIGLMQESFVS